MLWNMVIFCCFKIRKTQFNFSPLALGTKSLFIHASFFPSCFPYQIYNYVFQMLLKISILDSFLVYMLVHSFWFKSFVAFLVDLSDTFHNHKFLHLPSQAWCTGIFLVRSSLVGLCFSLHTIQSLKELPILLWRYIW